MTHTSLTMVAALSACAVLGGCSVEPLDSAAEPDIEPSVVVVTQGSGDSGCVPNQTTCYAWSGSTQVQGMCTVSGVCCTGCIDSRGACRGGSDSFFCGIGGGACSSCFDTNECTVDICSAGACHHDASDNSVSCDRGNGRCNAVNSSCCTGAFASVYDVPSMTNVLQCVTSCPTCTCKNATTYVCEPSPDIIDCTCP